MRHVIPERFQSVPLEKKNTLAIDWKLPPIVPIYSYCNYHYLLVHDNITYYKKQIRDK